MTDNTAIYLFNPSTEIALAHNGATFTPRKAIMLFEQRLALLPALYANEGSAILLPHCCDINEAKALPYYNLISSRSLRIITKNDLRGRTDPFNPWGWNRALVSMLNNAGYAGSSLPSAEMMDNMRNLASRRTAVEIWQQACNKHSYDRQFFTERIPRCFSNLDEAVAFSTMWHEGAVIKSPWSSSGRGVFFTKDKSAEQISMRISDVLRAQGHVIVEPWWNKTMDFATEWQACDGNVNLLGFSLFATDEAGHYAGNCVADQATIIDSLTKHTEKDYLLKQVEVMGNILSEVIASRYSGPFGVDMLIDSNGLINPCVEINLRTTMGHVALALWHTYQREFTFIPGNELPA